MKSRSRALQIHPRLWHLIRGFLQRLPLPRLIHFIDLVLPQMVPVSSPSQSSRTTFPGSQLVRDQWIAQAEGRSVKMLDVFVSRLFKSHAEIAYYFKASCLTALVTHFSTWGIRCWSSQAWVWPILPMTSVQKGWPRVGLLNFQTNKDMKITILKSIM